MFLCAIFSLGFLRSKKRLINIFLWLNFGKCSFFPFSCFWPLTRFPSSFLRPSTFFIGAIYRSNYLPKTRSTLGIEAGNTKKMNHFPSKEPFLTFPSQNIERISSFSLAFNEVVCIFTSRPRRRREKRTPKTRIRLYLLLDSDRSEHVVKETQEERS